MIKVILDGIEAEEYIKTQVPDTSTLAIALQTATEYIDMLEKKLKGYEDQFKPIEADDLIHTNLDDPKRHNISGSMGRPAQHQAAEAKIVRDTAIAEETKPMEMGLANTKWTKGELGLIYYLMDRPETELNRKLDTLLTKLKSTDDGGRTEPAIRAKLNELDIKIVNGIMYYN